MKSTYRIDAAQLVKSDIDDAIIIIYSQLTDIEKENILQEFKLEPTDLEAICDPDEVPRMEITEDGILLIWKRPDNVSCGDTIQFEVSSLGIVMTANRVIFIIPHGDISVTGREFKRVHSALNCVLRLLLSTVHHYQDHLKAIKMISQELQAKIVTSMGNHYLLQMFALGESLVYYHNALEANFSVLSKLRTIPEKLGLTTEDIALLDDLIVENQQASKQASIYSTVLSGLMDARGTIINNNMNILLKNLTIINIVFLPLNLIASIGGMSEYSVMTQGMDWRISYSLFSLAMVVLGWLTWWWVVKVVDRKQNMGKKKIN